MNERYWSMGISDLSFFFEQYIAKCTLTMCEEECANSEVALILFFTLLVTYLSAVSVQTEHIQGVCMCTKCGGMFVRASVCQRATLVWPACKATSSIIGSSSCSFRAGRLSCPGPRAEEDSGGGMSRPGFRWSKRMLDRVLARGTKPTPT